MSEFKCPKCEKQLLLRDGRKGKFWSCGGYPDCRYAVDDDNGKPGKPRQTGEVSDKHKCPKCGKALASREGKYGRWWGCTGFFEGCDFKADDAGGEPKILVCPDCGQFLKSGSNDRGAYTVCRNVAGHIDGLNHFFDENGKLREKHESTLVPNGEFKCPECGRPLSYILQKKGKDAGKPVFACFNKEGHGGNVLFYKDDAGAPVF